MSGFSHQKIRWLHKAKSYTAKKWPALNKLLMEVNIGRIPTHIKLLYTCFAL